MHAGMYTSTKCVVVINDWKSGTLNQKQPLWPDVAILWLGFILHLLL